jgi:hypothetical protein
LFSLLHYYIIGICFISEMSSRPKRVCKHAANVAIGFESDGSDDIYDDASENDEDQSIEMEENVESNDDTQDSDAVTNLSSNSEDESTEDESRSTVEEDLDFISSSRTVWSTIAPSNRGRHAMQNVMNFHAGPALGVNPTNEREAVLMFLDVTFQDTLHYTNLQGRRRIQKWNNSHPSYKKKWKMVDRDELEAFIGLLIIMGAFRARYRDVEEL